MLIECVGPDQLSILILNYQIIYSIELAFMPLVSSQVRRMWIPRSIMLIFALIEEASSCPGPEVNTYQVTDKMRHTNLERSGTIIIMS